MQPLISIETVPISIEFVEKTTPRKSMKISGSSAAEFQVSQRQRKTAIRSKPIQMAVQRDSFEKRMPSMGWNDLSYTAAAYGTKEKGQMHMPFLPLAPQRYEQFQRSIGHIADAIQQTAAEAFDQEGFYFNLDMTMLTGILPFRNDWETSVYPPELELHVVEYPHVIIKYIGGPIYIPPSADPDYEQSFDERLLIGDKYQLNQIV